MRQHIITLQKFFIHHYDPGIGFTFFRKPIHSYRQQRSADKKHGKGPLVFYSVSFQVFPLHSPRLKSKPLQCL